MSRLTIPARYLEDVRTAIIAELRDDSGYLKTNQSAVSNPPTEVERADRDAAAKSMRDDIHILNQLLGATGKTEITAESDSVIHLLEQVVRLLTKRLKKEMRYAPVDMDAVDDLADQLKWAACESLVREPPRTDDDVASDGGDR